jgi:hypothetical protein
MSFSGFAYEQGMLAHLRALIPGSLPLVCRTLRMAALMIKLLSNVDSRNTLAMARNHNVDP